MTETRATLLQLRLPASPEAAAAARAAIDRLPQLAAHAERAFDICLLTSELIDNAVRHGAAPDETIRVQILALTGTCLRVEVEDEGPGFTAKPVKPSAHEQTSGRGLWLLSALADRWGIDRNHRTRVWFELDLATPRRPPDSNPTRLHPTSHHAH
jgi:anti-sigma regulatory factor (Ser/Thr protein kinase)